MSYRFEDYQVITGYTNTGNKPYAALEEFAALVAAGETPEQAIENLRHAYIQRIAFHEATGEPIPAPGSGKASVGFAPDDRIRELGLIVDDFWKNILGTSVATSFVSNESRLATWDYYCGGRANLIRRVKQRYGIDISAYYSEPIHVVLKKLKEEAGRKSS